MSEVGDLFAGRYRIRRHLGTGAMGVVWLADDERLERPVAVKQLLQQPTADAAGAEQARQRALREGRVAARLHHPNAIAVHDATEHDGLPLLVMEYFPGTSLAASHAASGALPPVTAARVGTQVADALAAAHAAGILHRDVKPANVLLGADGTAKLADFGIAQAGGDVALTGTGVVPGTPAYLAPEVARGEAPSPASDVFSLGALLYALVQGTPPFGDSDENPLALLHRVVTATIPHPDRAGPLTPVLASMLAADPRHRPDAGQVREATRAVAEGRQPPTLAPAEAEGHTQPLSPVPAASPAPAPAPAANGTRFDLRPLDAAPEGPAEATASQPSGGPRARPGRTGIALGAGGLVVAVALVAIILGSGGDDTSTAASPTTTTPDTTTTTPRPLAADAMRQAVADFYARLPDRIGAAWQYLAPELRTQGREAFAARFDGVDEVTVVSAPRVTNTDRVQVGIRLKTGDGTTVTEFHRHDMVRLDGSVLLRTDTLLRSETSAPPKKDEKNEDHPGQGEKNKKKDERRGRGEREKNENKDKDKDD